MSLLQSTICTAPAEGKAGERNRILSRIMSFMLLLVVCFNLTVPANAYSVVHIQASIDLATWEILTGVVRDEVGLTGCSPEWKRMGEQALTDLNKSSDADFNLLGQIDVASVASRDKKVANSGLLSGAANLLGFTEEKGRVLTFPTDQVKRDSSTSADMESALAANNAIVFDLNQAFRVYCDREHITKKPDAAAMLTAMNSFMGSVSHSGDYVSYYASASGDKMTNYRWRTDKYQGGSEKITWSMLIVEAFTNYSFEGEEAVDSDNVYSGNPNQLTKAMVGFFEGVLDSLRSILGLWSMDELLFNEGWRSSGYVGGIFPMSWEPTIWALFFFMEIIAAMILLVGVAMSVLKQAASTMNTIARIHAMSQIQDMLVCAVALTLLPLALRMVIALSGNLVDIVSAMRPTSIATGNPKTVQEMVQRFASGNNTIGGIIAQCLFFGAQVYFNFFYALRALTTAILIIIAPMMIAMITVSSSRKQTTITWMKELLANILVQPIHTFCITVILLLPTSTHGFDNLIAIYAMIPFTSMIRSLFFGPAGSFADQAASKGAAITNGAITGATMGAASRLGSGIGGGLLSFAKDKLSGGGEGGSEGSSESGAGGAGGTNTDLSNANAEKNSNAGKPSDANSGGVAGGANGGPAAGAGGADGGTGEPAPDTSAASISAAQNSAAPNTTQPSASVQPPANNAPKPSMKERWINFANSKAGRGLGRAAAIGGGAILGGIGGAFSGAGLHSIGAPIESAADSLVYNRGRQKKEEDSKNKDEEQNQNQERIPNENNLADSKANNSGADLDLSKQHLPVDLNSIGKQKANDSSNGKEMQVRDLDQEELSKHGISGVEDMGNSLEFTANGDSQQAKELGAYADYLKTLPPDQRQKEISDRGIEATRTDDGVQVRIDKDKWSQANNGAEINARINPETGKPVMRIKSTEGEKAPSFTGTAPKVAVHPVSVPNATHSRLPSVRRDGEEASCPQDVEQKALDSGLSGYAAVRAAERVGAIRELRTQGYNETETARMSKKMVSGIHRNAEVSIPKAELTDSQDSTMIQAMRAGEISADASAYHVRYKMGEEPVYEAPVSFSNYMADYASEATLPSVSAPVDAGVDSAAAPIQNAPAPAPGDTPVEAPANEQDTVTTSSEQNNVATVPSQSAAVVDQRARESESKAAQAALAQRATVYRTAKQQGDSPEQAFRKAQWERKQEHNSGEGAASVNMGRNVRPAPAPATPQPAPVRTAAQSSTNPTSPPASTHGTQEASGNNSMPVEQNAPPPPQQSGSPLQRERAQEPLVYQDGDQSNLTSDNNQLTQESILNEALSKEAEGFYYDDDSNPSDG